MLSPIPPRRALISLAALLGLAGTVALPAGAASHRDAPLLTQDPTADQNDVYAFVSNNDDGQKVLNLAVSYIPLEEAADGPNYYKFADDVRYDINIANTAQLDAKKAPVFSGRADLTFTFQFHTRYLCTRNTIVTFGIGAGCDDGSGADLGNGGTGLGPITSVGDAHQNLRQTYTVQLVNHDSGTTTDLSAGRTLPQPPDNVGRTTPLYNQGQAISGTVGTNNAPNSGDNPAQSGAQTTAALDPYTQQSIYTLANGIKVFAGQRADAFYIDLAPTFDRLNLRPPGAPVNSLQGYNVHLMAVQIPLTQLASAQCPNGECVMGIYAASYRRAVTVRPVTRDQAQGGDTAVSPRPGTNYGDEGVANVSSAYSTGPWRQVGRMGNPLVDEIFVGLQDKDRWNQSKPEDDQQFAKYAMNPEPGRLIQYTLGIPVQTTNRTDLAAIFSPDLLRVDTSTAPVPLQAGDPPDAATAAHCPGSSFNVLSSYGNDNVYSPFQGACIGSGYPNGRRFPDDATAIVVDQVINSPGHAGPYTTGLAETAPTFNHVFPFAATPYNGRNHQHAPQ